MHRIVLDTNILVGAFLTPKGENSEVLRRAKSQKLYLSPFILSEVWRTLRVTKLQKKYRYSDIEAVQYMQSLRFIGRIHTPEIKVVKVCPDPDDNHILTCAVDVQADYLVTRNIKDFPKSYRGVKIIPPEKFLQLVSRP